MIQEGGGQRAEGGSESLKGLRPLPSALRPLGKWLIVALLWAWLLFLTLTHYGAKSPYSYGWAIFNEKSAHLMGAVVNPDATGIHTVTMFFYDATPIWWDSAHNMALPLHSFATSIIAGYVRSYLLANFIANFIFAALLALAAVNLADRFAIRRGATLVALMTIFTLPMYVDYLGQPMQYIVGPATGFLVVMAVLALSPEDARRPWIAGIATAVVAINYDPYVFLAALVTYFLFVSRLRNVWAYAVFILTAALPRLVWHQFLRLHSDGAMTKQIRRAFMDPVVDGWTEWFRAPLDNVLMPFVASHIGVDVALRQVIAMIHWPLLAVGLYLLVRLRPELRAVKGLSLIALLPLFFLLEQLAAAAFDWEQNPRRAIPVVLAFGVAYVWCAHRTWHLRRWRAAFFALLLLSGTLAISDTLFRSPVMAYLHTGQAIRGAPSEPMRIQKLRLSPDSMPTLMRDEQPIIWNDLGRARLARDRRVLFAGTQAFNALLLVALFWICARARILPRWSPAAVAVIWALSLVARFV